MSVGPPIQPPAPRQTQLPTPIGLAAPANLAPAGIGLPPPAGSRPPPAPPTASSAPPLLHTLAAALPPYWQLAPYCRSLCRRYLQHLPAPPAACSPSPLPLASLPAAPPNPGRYLAPTNFRSCRKLPPTRPSGLRPQRSLPVALSGPHGSLLALTDANLWLPSPLLAAASRPTPPSSPRRPSYSRPLLPIASPWPAPPRSPRRLDSSSAHAA
ncbi:proline-rich receptor-like protein kinase PERK2 [Cryptomeria japonica]|uniref:proline-rich receptor-like protein kinase PERK2 n=1 Tax=Cryptomeria japonica TaxID=3369 RepID=UPI0027DA02D4|nr:proline-rich receptor-like protein kinase PERK2 [Cryptomeria japonica]